MQRQKPWFNLKVGPATVYAVMLALTIVAPTCLRAGTTCVTPTGSVPCNKGPVRKQVTLPTPGAAPSRAAAAKLRQQQVTTQRQQQVGGQRQELLKQRRDEITKQRAGIRSGLNSKNSQSPSGGQPPKN